jgi:ribokinase
MPDVVALGDVNVDVIAHFASYPAKGQDALADTTEYHCGGSAANTAIALACMGLDVCLIARVGSDPLAPKALDNLREAGVTLSGLQRDPAVATGLMYIVVTPDGERTILGHRGANVFTDPNQIREQDIQDAKLFHLSGYALLADPQRSAALLGLEMARRHGLAVALDPGMSVSQAVLDEVHALLPAVDIFMPNLTEAQRLTGQIQPEPCAQALLGAGAKVVALKLGGDGCLIGDREGIRHVPGFAVETRDTTGAGDTFAAGVIAGFLGRLDWCSAAMLGNAMGAMAAARVGAGMLIPWAQEVLKFLGEHRQEASHRECGDAFRQAMNFVGALARRSEEEGEIR